MQEEIKPVFIKLPAKLWAKVKAKAALEQRTVTSVAIELFLGYVKVKRDA